MSKLTEWLCGIVLFLSVWIAVLSNQTPLKVTDDLKIWIYLVSKHVHVKFNFKMPNSQFLFRYHYLLSHYLGYLFILLVTKLQFINLKLL